MAWVFTGHFLDNFASDRTVAGTGELQELPGKFALAGLVDAHSHHLQTGLFTHGRKQSASWPMAGIDWVRDVSTSRLNGQQVK